MTEPTFSRATPGEIYKRRLQGDAAGLVQLLETPEAAASKKLRRDIVLALGRIDATAALPALRRLATSDTNEEVRLFAVAALAGAGDRESIAVFDAALDERNPNIRTHAIKGLERSGLADAVKPLIRALESDKISTRTSAARALARLGDPAAIGPLERAVQRTWRPFARAYLKMQLQKLKSSRAA